MPLLSFRICWFQETASCLDDLQCFKCFVPLVSLFWLFCQHLFFLSWGGGHVLPMLYDWYFDSLVALRQLSLLRSNLSALY